MDSVSSKNVIPKLRMKNDDDTSNEESSDNEYDGESENDGHIPHIVEDLIEGDKEEFTQNLEKDAITLEPSSSRRTYQPRTINCT